MKNNSRIMTFCAGIALALLVAQAAKEPPKPSHPDIGRFQMQARGTMPELWILDTATGYFFLFKNSPTAHNGLEQYKVGAFPENYKDVRPPTE